VVLVVSVEHGTTDPEGPERSGRIAHGLRRTSIGPPCEEDVARVPTRPTPGRTLVTRRAVVDIVRTATLGSYGVTGFAGGPLARLLGRLGLVQPGIDVRLDDEIAVDLDLTVAFGVPIAEVARQVDSAVRYAVERALGRKVGHLTVHVDGLRFGPIATPPVPITADPAAVRPRDLADSGTDVA
jgi:uncharacterized alkaline shock family protein YloU